MSKAVFQITALLILLIGTSFSEAFLPVAVDAATPGITADTRIMPVKEKGTLYGWQKCMAHYWETADTHASPHAAFRTCQDRIALFFKADVKITAQAFPGSDCSEGAPAPYLRSIRATIRNQSTDTVVTAAQVGIHSDALKEKPVGAITAWLAPGESLTRCINLGDQKLKNTADARAFYAHPEQISYAMRNIQGITLADRALPR